MPILLHIDYQLQLITATADGEVSSQDLQHVIADIIAARAMQYRKLFDVTAARVSDASRIGEVAATVRLYAAKAFGDVGPVAVVIAPNVESPVARSFVALALAERPLRFFEDRAAALDWLNGLL